MKTYIYFVRHAISPFSLENERSRGLSDQGRLDADRIVEALKNEGIDLICSSSYSRAVETVKPLAEYLDLEIIKYEELIERPIATVKQPLREVELLAGIERSFIDMDYCLLGGETTRQAQDRAVPVIKQLLTDHTGKKVVIGTHGNIMTIILNYFDKAYGYDFWKSTSKPDIYKLVFQETELLQVERLWNTNQEGEGY